MLADTPAVRNPSYLRLCEGTKAIRCKIRFLQVGIEAWELIVLVRKDAGENACDKEEQTCEHVLLRRGCEANGD